MVGRKSHTRLDKHPCSPNCYMTDDDVRARLDAERPPADDDKDRDNASSSNVAVAPSNTLAAPSNRGRKRKRVMMLEPRENGTSAASSCSEESDTDVNGE